MHVKYPNYTLEMFNYLLEMWFILRLQYIFVKITS